MSQKFRNKKNTEAQPKLSGSKKMYFHEKFLEVTQK